MSALLRPVTPPALVLDLVLSRQIDVALDERIFAEYADVLARVELHLPADRVTAVLDFLWRGAERIRAATLPIRLPDPDDVMFIEVAVSALASALVTGNTRHYPAAQRHGVRVLTPREYLAEWFAGPWRVSHVARARSRIGHVTDH